MVAFATPTISTLCKTAFLVPFVRVADASIVRLLLLDRVSICIAHRCSIDGLCVGLHLLGAANI